MRTMGGADAGFRYDSKRALVVGGASGIGAATVDVLVDLGADVVVMDVAPVQRSDVGVLHVDLADKASIERAVEQCGGPIDALFSCAGVADGPKLPAINFIGQRHLVERAVDGGLMPRGSAIAMVSSAGGRGWEANLDTLLEYVWTPTVEAAEEWIAAHPEFAGYAGSKQAVCVYAGSRAYPFGKKGIRINVVMPGPTDTPLARANAEVWLTYATDYRTDLGLGPSMPEEQASILAFLCSAAARRIVGASVMSDAGHAISRFTRSFPPAG
jgi:NAD(P)-dependent dehydrogenase (short-subunit alcohol dehydrogenase family)